LEARQAAILGELQTARDDMMPTQAELSRGARSLDGGDPSVASFDDDDDQAGRMRSGLAGASLTPEEMRRFEAVGSREFEYKPEFQDQPGAGRGRFAGPMTSELKQIPGVVEQRPDGIETVNTPRLTMANASATGELARADRAKQAQLDELNARLSALQEATGGDDPDEALRAARSGRF
jgi:hypothetical protein